ncbi:uncharacterized protein F5891DRAFT_121619 [Suillus fuscotomentosus]|uniref:F-box domain-containing protein n=1 Tax=Suillus fuscotomentosus TaxID=1912939 RepID=A0AAD4DR12_9AGAM|nr:uncharacterized protein F5891DRAFT_121619 [Suillus fuscotomentosus]KAG1890534.1 hypothetical protein F5891DRAFT_121619 [Suillus fuscotomentosus]
MFVVPASQHGQHGVHSPSKFVVDVWLVIMKYLSVLDIVRLGSTCQTLHEFASLRHVWRDVLFQHRFLDQCYPHLRSCTAEDIRHQLKTAARLDHLWTQSSIVPKRLYTFPLDFPGVFQGLKFLPGGTWLVLLFHCRNLNPSRHSNLCLVKPSTGAGFPAVSTTFQSEMCWLPFLDQDGPYRSSRGDNLILLRTKCNDGSNAFGIVHLNTKIPSITIPLIFRTNVFVRNYAASGDYIVYGWITADRRHFLRIMQLNDNYDGFRKDMTVEIDCPKGHDGKLRIRYDLRLSGRVPCILLISTRLMAAYNIPSNVPNNVDANLPPLLTPFWQLRPAAVTFGRFVKLFHEGAIVSLYEGQIRFIRPHLDASEPNTYAIEKYNFDPPHPQNLQRPCLFSAQRIFWRSSLKNQKGTTSPWQMTIETSGVSENVHREGRVLIDLQETQTSAPSASTRIVQDWDELSGRLCIRSIQSRFAQDPRCRKTTWRVTLVDFV